MYNGFNTLKILIFSSFVFCIPFLGFGEISILAKIASITGYFGLLCLFWSMVLGSKIITRALNLDYQKINKVHRYLGKYGIIFVLAHPLLQSFLYLENYNWIFTLDFSSRQAFTITLGRLALSLFCIIWASSVILRSKLRYRPWIRLHYLTYPLFLLSLLHIRNTGYYWNNINFLGLFWDVVLILYILYLGYIGLLFAGFFKQIYILKSIKITGKGSKIAVLELESIGKKIHSKPGQYIYLSTKRFGEIKPFSILWNRGNQIKLGIKLEGNFTKKIHTLKTESKLLLYGPFGQFTKEGQNKKPKIIIAGGIGITPLVQFASRYFTPDSKFILCNRYPNDNIELDEIKSIAKENLFEFYSETKGKNTKNVFYNRLDKVSLIKIINSLDLSKYKIFVCGSEDFTSSVIGNLISIGVKKNSIFTEKFSI